MYSNKSSTLSLCLQNTLCLGNVKGWRTVTRQCKKNSKSIISLVTNPLTGNAYQDQLCFFRALALSKGASIRNLEKPIKELLEIWLKFKGQNQFATIGIESLDQLEQCFEVYVNIYQMTRKGVVKL